jgi:hypothetical protein
VQKQILWVWTRYIGGKCKKNTLNENLSMAMYALIHKLLQQKSKKKSKLWNRGKSKSKSKRNPIMK